MNYIDLFDAKEIYIKGQNVTEYLRIKFDEKGNTSDIIEIAYDLQAGSYIKFVKSNYKLVKLTISEMANIFACHVSNYDSLLDVGTGELTTLSLMLNECNLILSEVLAFDISWSRLSKGIKFFRENISRKNIDLKVFSADIKQIPLHSKCVDVVTSSHALEPNGNSLSTLLKELFRVAKKKLVLFEPSYELNSLEGKQRMDRLGYIKGMESTVVKLGGKMLDIISIKNSKTLNPTACYVIEPPPTDKASYKNKPTFCVPGTDYILDREEGFFVSKNTGMVYPVLDEIPILKNQNGILATAKF